MKLYNGVFTQSLFILMAAQADFDASLQLLQQIQETQGQIEILNTQIAKINKRITLLQVKHKRCDAALEYLTDTPADYRVYKQVSRLLILRNPEQVRCDLEAEKQTSIDDLPKFNKLREQLIAKLNSLSCQFVELNKHIAASRKVLSG
ncbi:bifunctional Prefoldin/Prefoldin beta-like [Babesia duncani]|uniref:Bifunctional Prefoldin/Prefoldin beta-like n=1 Tax=Babesia duncani TaxID=323732 RepID=A0AAD9PIF8_9APIC|nr:bifunctional Prefoldin/Prefoldin beta-like [Babesia duncani]